MVTKLVVTLTAAVALGGAAVWWATTTGTETEGEAAGAPTELTLEATDFDFSLPATIDAGPVRVTFSNTGKKPHQAFFYELREGVSFERFRAAVMTDNANLPKLARSGWVIGIGDVLHTGETRTYRDELTAGRYAVVCFVSDEKTAKNHSELGMIAPLEVR